MAIVFKVAIIIFQFFFAQISFFDFFYGHFNRKIRILKLFCVFLHNLSILIKLLFFKFGTWFFLQWEMFNWKIYKILHRLILRSWASKIVFFCIFQHFKCMDTLISNPMSLFFEVLLIYHLHYKLSLERFFDTQTRIMLSYVQMIWKISPSSLANYLLISRSPKLVLPNYEPFLRWKVGSLRSVHFVIRFDQGRALKKMK